MLPSSDRTFKDWVFRYKPNRILLLISILAILLQLIIFKFLYPFPNFIPESTNYIDAAAKNSSLNVWPIAYSKFLRVFNTFITSDTGLVAFQYCFLQGCIIYFLFSISWFLRLPRLTITLLFILNLCNPILLHLANFVSSDSIYVGLSIIWFTQMFWLLHRPTLITLCLHALVLFLCFVLRFFAIYYPIVSICLLLLLHTELRIKLIGAGLFLAPIILFIIHTTQEYRQQTGTTQYSAFGGWQIGANALYAYSQTVPLDSPNTLPARFRPLHAIVNQHMIALSHYKVRPDQQIGIYYQWDDNAPLKVYMYQCFKRDSITDGFKKYALMGSLYAAYGTWVIKRHPVNYLLHFVLPNAVDYYAPNPEFMETENMGFDSVDKKIATWFALKSRKIGTHNQTKKIHLAGAFTIIVPVINVLFIFMLAMVFFSKGYMDTIPLLKPILRITFIMWLANMLFSVSSAWIILRYEIFPLIVTLSFATACISLVIQEMQATKTPSLTDAAGTTSPPLSTGLSTASTATP